MVLQIRAQVGGARPRWLGGRTGKDDRKQNTLKRTYFGLQSSGANQKKSMIWGAAINNVIFSAFKIQARYPAMTTWQLETDPKYTSDIARVIYIVIQYIKLLIVLNSEVCFACPVILLSDLPFNCRRPGCNGDAMGSRWLSPHKDAYCYIYLC